MKRLENIGPGRKDEEIFSAPDLELRKTIKFDKIDWEKEHEKNIKFYNNWWENENKRIEKIKCPVCKSIKKHNIKKTNSNNIIGPGHRSWVTEEYLVCGKCGVMYKDLNKPKDVPSYPKNRFF